MLLLININVMDKIESKTKFVMDTETGNQIFLSDLTTKTLDSHVHKKNVRLSISIVSITYL